jgi:hypothetical protein
VALADLGIGNGMVMIAFPGNETGKTFTSTIDKVEPEVIRQWAMAIGALGVTQKVADNRDVIGLHLPFDI